MAEEKRERFVMITTFVVPMAMEEGFLAWWRMAAPFFRMQPGFLSARLHRSLDQKERYRFINIAEWEGGKAQRDALAQLWSSAPRPNLPGLEWHPAIYEVVGET